MLHVEVETHYDAACTVLGSRNPPIVRSVEERVLLPGAVSHEPLHRVQPVPLDLGRGVHLQYRAVIRAGDSLRNGKVLRIACPRRWNRGVTDDVASRICDGRVAISLRVGGRFGAMRVLGSR